MNNFVLKTGWSLDHPPQPGMKPYGLPCVKGEKVEWDLYWSYPEKAAEGNFTEEESIEWPFIDGYEPDDEDLEALGFDIRFV